VGLTEARTEPRRGGFFLLRAVLLVVVVPVLVVVGYGAFSLQGHQEDFPSKPMQTWPIGATSFVLAAALSWAVARPSRGLQPAIVAVALVSFLLAWVPYL
jgi:hypothetical protein